MSKREFILFLLIIVLIVIPINNGYGWNYDYQMNKGTEIPFESSLHTSEIWFDSLQLDNQYWVDRLNNFTYGDVLHPMPEFDMKNYFYIIAYVYSYGDKAELLSLNYDDERYNVHIKIDRRDRGSFDGDQFLLLEISNSYAEEYSFSPGVEFYIVDYNFDFYFYGVLDLLIVTRIIYLRSKKRQILGSFFDTKYSKYISLDNLTKDTLKDLERREELRNAMDPED